MTYRNGLASLLRPKNSVLVLIDHQPYQLANLNSHDPHYARHPEHSDVVVG
jgi:hypothetical protein